MRVLLALLAGLLACAVQPQPDIDFHSTRWHMDQTVQNALATVQRVLEQDKRGPILRCVAAALLAAQPARAPAAPVRVCEQGGPNAASLGRQILARRVAH